MTLLQATTELRTLAGGEYSAITVKATIYHTGEGKIEAMWYVDGREWSEQFPSLEACIADAQTVLSVPLRSLDGAQVADVAVA